jgi:hypothetical protein
MSLLLQNLRLNRDGVVVFGLKRRLGGVECCIVLLLLIMLGSLFVCVTHRHPLNDNPLEFFFAFGLVIVLDTVAHSRTSLKREAVSVCPLHLLIIPFRYEPGPLEQMICEEILWCFSKLNQNNSVLTHCDSGA